MGTAWRPFVGSLESGLSESPVAATLPDDVAVTPPTPDLPIATARWSGEWRGWGGLGMSVDARLVVEALHSDGVDLVVAWADADKGARGERLRARFEDDELRGTLASGADIAFRRRDADVAEFHVSQPGGGWMCGVLARADPDSAHRVERVPTGRVANGRDETLEVVVFRPNGPGPFPTLVFNHGSTGTGTDPASFRYTWTCPPLARFFTRRGWMVVFPQRRGRGKSDGAYAEGLKPSGKGYSTLAKVALAGVDHALDDVVAVVDRVRTRDDVDADRLVIGGQSRGGALAIAAAGARPGTFRGAIEFAGGWLGDAAPSAAEVNRRTFERGAAFDAPTLWLHADGDSYYSLAHSRASFEAFERAGGRGAFHAFPLDERRDGHRLVHRPALWGALVDDYLARVAPTRP